jgi:hypothetical protein
VCLEAASTFNVLLSKYSSAHSLPLSNPHLIYLIFTVAMAHLSGYRQLDSVSTTASLQTQLHLLNCLEAFQVVGRTWRLAARCWKVLDRLMDAEGMKPRARGNEGTGSALGKRKRTDAPSVAVDHRQQHRRENSLSAATTSAVSDSSITPQYSSSIGAQDQYDFSLWPPSVYVPPTATAALPSSSMSQMNTTSKDYLFDPDFLSSNTGWIPEVNTAGSFEDMWNTSNWDENFWARSLQAPLGTGMEGNFVMGPGAEDLAF